MEAILSSADLLDRLPLLEQWRTVGKTDKTYARNAFVIEFAGMPKAGKSTAIEGIRHFFTHGPKLLDRNDAVSKSDYRRIGYRVHTPAEGVSLRTPNFLKDDLFDFNTWAGAYAVQELLQAAHDDHHDLVILDRGPWDAGCWLEYWASKDEAGPRQAQLIKVKEFFQLPYWMTRSDLHVVLTVESGDASQREETNRLIRHNGASSNTGLMERMRSIYTDRFEELKKTKANDCPHVGRSSSLLIDTTGMDRKLVTQRIIAAAFDVMAAKIARHQETFTFSVEFVRNQLAGYLQLARSQHSKSLEAWLPEFVEMANNLEPEQRQFLRTDLMGRAMPPEPPLVEQRVTAEALKQSLNNLINKAKRT
jgi:hypothetical protein